MSFPVTAEGGYDVVHLAGDVDLPRAPELRHTLLACLAQGHATLVDLGAVSYIDGAAIAVLVEAMQSAHERGLAFGLVGVNAAVMRVLELAHLDQAFPMHATLRARLAAEP